MTGEEMSYEEQYMEHRRRIEALLRKLVADGYLISDLMLQQGTTETREGLTWWTKVVHRPSGRILTGNN